MNFKRNIFYILFKKETVARGIKRYIFKLFERQEFKSQQKFFFIYILIHIQSAHSKITNQ